MTAQIPIALLKEVRQQLASAIADFKSYEVPRLCVRLGLAEGTELDAHTGKFRYAMNRLTEVDGATVLNAARRLLEEEEDFSLAEIVARIEESGGKRVGSVRARASA